MAIGIALFIICIPLIFHLRQYVERKRGIEFAGKRDYEQAIRCFSKAIDFNPSSQDFYNRGLMYFNQEKLDLAVADFKTALVFNPDNVDALMNLARVFSRLKQYDQAVMYLNKVIELEPKNMDKLKIRALLYYKQKKYDQSVDDFNKIIVADPRNAEMIYFRGVIFSLHKKYDQAIKDFNQSFSLITPSAAKLYNRGLAYHAKKKYDQAIKDFSRAIEMAPNKANLYEARSEAYSDHNELENSIIDAVKVDELKNNRDPGKYLSRLSTLLLFRKTKLFPWLMSKFRNAIPDSEMTGGDIIVREYLQAVYLIVNKQPFETQLNLIDSLLRKMVNIDLEGEFLFIDLLLELPDNGLDSSQKQAIAILTARLKKMKGTKDNDSDDSPENNQ